MSYITRVKQSALIALASFSLGTIGFAQAPRTKPNKAEPAEPAKPAQAGDKKAPESKPATTNQLLTPVEAAMEPDLMKMVQANAEWKMAMEILSEDGEAVNLKEAKVLRLVGQAKAIEVTAKISTSVPGRTPEYGNLVFQTDPKGTAFVYFSNPQKTPKDNPKKENEKSIKLCGPWSGWQAAASYCGYSFSCFGKGQVATYHDSTRTRQCRTGVISHTCHVKEHCGCP